MPANATLTRANLRTPKAAAIAGIAFSFLMIAIFWLLRRSIPSDPMEPGAWLASDTRTVGLALNLVPFAGVAFLWFIGVLRDRLGDKEDRFFATVFFGSGVLFLAMLFAAAALVGAVNLTASSAGPNELINSATFRFARDLDLHHPERVRGQDGGGVHDLHLDRRHLHRDRAAMDGVRRLPAGVGHSGRQLLHHLELCHFADLGLSDQHPRAAGQPAPVTGMTERSPVPRFGSAIGGNILSCWLTYDILNICHDI